MCNIYFGASGLIFREKEWNINKYLANGKDRIRIVTASWDKMYTDVLKNNLRQSAEGNGFERQLRPDER